VRVLVLSNLYPPNALGGYELACRDVVDRWRGKGHEVTVLTTSTAVSGTVETGSDDPHVVRRLEWWWADHVFLDPGPRGRLALERRVHRVLDEVLAQVRPEVVSVWHMGGMPLSLLRSLDERGLPVVYNLADDWPAYGPQVDPWQRSTRRLPKGLVRRLTGVPAGLPDLDRAKVSSFSAFTVAQLRRRTRWSFPDVTVTGGGVDVRDFPLVASGPPRPWTWQLLAVGRVERRKGFDTAVAALAELPPEARLRIAGVDDGTHQRELEGLAAELGVADRVVVAGVPRAELRQLYAGADALLFPSRWEEPFGIVPLEAMTQATPVVATRRGGSAEYLTDGSNCLAVAHDDPPAMAAALRRLAGDDELRRRLADGGLRTAAELTTDHLADRLEALHLQAATVAAW
jgi:glycosyltransferase involved in cell wall biosynthesis